LMAKPKTKPPARSPFRWEPPFTANKFEFDLSRGEIRVPDTNLAQRGENAELHFTGAAYSSNIELTPTGLVTVEPEFTYIPGPSGKLIATLWGCRGAELESEEKPEVRKLFVVCTRKDLVGRVELEVPRGWGLKK
jgi:hypothetical protein